MGASLLFELVSTQGVSLTLNGPSQAPAEAPLPLVHHYYDYTPVWDLCDACSLHKLKFVVVVAKCEWSCSSDRSSKQSAQVTPLPGGFCMWSCCYFIEQLCTEIYDAAALRVPAPIHQSLRVHQIVLHHRLSTMLQHSRLQHPASRLPSRARQAAQGKHLQWPHLHS